MVTVEIKVNRQKKYIGFICSGHAGYGESGYDIVCAAISILTHTIAASLESIVGLPLRVKADENQGYLECTWDPQPDKAEQSDLLIKTLILGLSEIHEQYPDHISLCEMEV
ncbi:MAG TPA: ribosomal-processing cysteine protease Prp [Bacillota bacterium]|nr:ribosomal-processing cysteine protease Prp [Bacillota bacterium]